jgi:hypothetical protein
MKHPDAKNHLIVSLGKSGLRILAAGFLCAGMLISAGVLLIWAELLGVLEEFV